MAIFAEVNMAEMRKVEFVPFLLTEANKFLIMLEDTEDPFLKDDYIRIVDGLAQIANIGALGRFIPAGRNDGRPRGGHNAIYTSEGPPEARDVAAILHQF